MRSAARFYYCPRHSTTAAFLDLVTCCDAVLTPHRTAAAYRQPSRGQCGGSPVTLDGAVLHARPRRTHASRAPTKLAPVSSGKDVSLRLAMGAGAWMHIKVRIQSIH